MTLKLDLRDPRQILSAYNRAREFERLGRREEAASIYGALARIGKAPMTFHRIVAEGLNRTGQPDTANELIASTIAARARTLPDRIETALERAWDRIDQQEMDPRALAWAWEHRAPDLEIDREEFERRARWGMAADMVLLDWLECRPDDMRAKDLFINGEERATALRAVLASERGYCVAGAHLGAVFAGPLYYHLHDLDVKYVGAFARLDASPMSRRLIPIPDLSREDLRREAAEVVDRGHILGMSIDGSLEGPLIDFGADGLPGVRVSPLLARNIHRTGCGSSFRYTTWEDGRLRIMTTDLPPPEKDEPFEPFFARWLAAYRDCVAAALATIRPEDLRLTSGLWRGIKGLQAPGR